MPPNDRDFQVPDRETIQDFVTRDDTAAAMVRTADQLGAHIQKVSSSQIRKVYGTLTNLKMEGWGEHTRRRLLLFKPQLAYAASRDQALTDLQKVLEPAIDAVVDAESFQRFCDLFEAVLAYHKAHGEKKYREAHGRK